MTHILLAGLESKIGQIIQVSDIDIIIIMLSKMKGEPRLQRQLEIPKFANVQSIRVEIFFEKKNSKYSGILLRR